MITMSGYSNINEILKYKEEYNIHENKKYLIYISDDQSISLGYLWFICKYDFRTENVKIVRSLEMFENMNGILDYNYFIILRKTDETNKFVNKIQGDVEKNVIKI